mmetsp:Transcript_53821/g.161058  ORF Transcript_53821/g.161058 Transcript_53821/m.161058 type:complete len:300 (-) Transcript_53821:29-928(-)
MIRVGEARLGGRTVRSSVVAIHQTNQRIDADPSSAVKGELALDDSSSTARTVETALDSSIGAPRAAALPSTSSSHPTEIVAIDSSSAPGNECTLSSLMEGANNDLKDDVKSGGDDQGLDVGQRLAPLPVEAAPQSKPSSAGGKDQLPMKKSVSFHVVEMREYTRALGDHPDTMLGPPITLSWDYCSPYSPIDVGKYELERGARRTKTQLIVHPNIRRKWLREGSEKVGGKSPSMPVTEKEMKQVERKVYRAALQRRNSASFHPIAGPVEEFVQSVKRKVKRRSWRSNDERWWEHEGHCK